MRKDPAKGTPDFKKEPLEGNRDPYSQPFFLHQPDPSRPRSRNGIQARIKGEPTSNMIQALRVYHLGPCSVRSPSLP